MEELKITITKESTIQAEELADFITQFNLLTNERVKKEIINLVKSLVKTQEN